MLPVVIGDFKLDIMMLSVIIIDSPSTIAWYFFCTAINRPVRDTWISLEKTQFGTRNMW